MNAALLWGTVSEALSCRYCAADAVQALWIGHASLLVQFSGVTFLTDPIISSRASPLSFAGPL